MLSAIDIFDFSPSKEVMPREYTWLDTKYVTLPNVVGLKVEEAKKTLKDFKLNYSGNGNKVIYQSPQADFYIPLGGEVMLMLSD